MNTHGLPTIYTADKDLEWDIWRENYHFQTNDWMTVWGLDRDWMGE